MSLHFNFPSNIQVGGGREDANACLVCGKVSCVHCGLNSNQCMWFDSTCLFCTAGRVSIVCGGLGMYRGATHVQYDVRQLWENPADTFEEWQKMNVEEDTVVPLLHFNSVKVLANVLNTLCGCILLVQFDFGF